MTTDYRALCAELVSELEEARQSISDWAGYASAYFQEKHDVEGELQRLANRIDEARAALAESIDCVACEDKPAPDNSPCSLCGRTAQPQPPAGEVGELVEGLRLISDGMSAVGHESDSWFVARAAELLEQLAQDHVADASKMVEPTDDELLRTYGLAKRDFNYEGPLDDWPKRAERSATVAGLRATLARWGRPAPQPIPVTERLPEAGDCIANPRNGQGQWCWGWKGPGSVETVAVLFSGEWRMMRREWLADDATHWLPAHALPLPAAEVKT